MHAYISRELISDRSAKVSQWGKNSIFNKLLKANCRKMQMNEIEALLHTN